MSGKASRRSSETDESDHEQPAPRREKRKASRRSAETDESDHEQPASRKEKRIRDFHEVDRWSHDDMSEAAILGEIRRHIKDMNDRAVFHIYSRSTQRSRHDIRAYDQKSHLDDSQGLGEEHNSSMPSLRSM